ncbi:hypothetical protein ASL14_13025 [Paenibacillus sp. IHB B 3084]|nr:hypothetical protein ASL14_13025 [Paenibacillus sp. IHB B 3084]
MKVTQTVCVQEATLFNGVVAIITLMRNSMELPVHGLRISDSLTAIVTKQRKPQPSSIYIRKN